MSFPKGAPKPPNSGRKKGVGNKVKVRKVRDVLAEQGLDPVAEITNLILNGDMKDKERADLWFKLHEYCEFKPKEMEHEPDESAEILDGFTEEQLLRIVNSDGSV